MFFSKGLGGIGAWGVIVLLLSPYLFSTMEELVSSCNSLVAMAAVDCHCSQSSTEMGVVVHQAVTAGSKNSRCA